MKDCGGIGGVFGSCSNSDLKKTPTAKTVLLVLFLPASERYAECSKKIRDYKQMHPANANVTHAHGQKCST